MRAIIDEKEYQAACRRQLLTAIAAVAAAAMLPAARGCEFFTTTLRITHPWTSAAAEREVAMVGMTLDQVSEPDRLIGVTTMVATGAELVRDGIAGPIDLVLLPDMPAVLRAPELYLRLTGLRQPLLIGRTYPLELEFEKGGSVRTQLSVDYERPVTRFR
jgi:copper(I)-binding protein